MNKKRKELLIVGFIVLVGFSSGCICVQHGLIDNPIPVVNTEFMSMVLNETQYLHMWNNTFGGSHDYLPNRTYFALQIRVWIEENPFYILNTSLCYNYRIWKHSDVIFEGVGWNNNSTMVFPAVGTRFNAMGNSAIYRVLGYVDRLNSPIGYPVIEIVLMREAM